MKIISGVAFVGFLAVFIWSTALYFQDMPAAAVHIGIDREEFIDVMTAAYEVSESVLLENGIDISDKVKARNFKFMSMDLLLYFIAYGDIMFLETGDMNYYRQSAQLFYNYTGLSETYRNHKLKVGLMALVSGLFLVCVSFVGILRRKILKRRH